MNDDQMDEMLIQGVSDYNEPGAVPREEMWKAIREGRKAKSEERKTLRVWPIAVAAALILAVGIVIGRRMDRATPVVSSPVAVVAKPIDSTKTRDSLLNEIRQETVKTGRRAQELASTETAPESSRTESDRSLAYHLVVLRHLAGSEAMISSFRNGARSGEMDAEMARWSRELLGTTRLLESSQAASDPVMKRLLDDLDLVISQIVQYTTKGTTNTDELDLIEQTISRRGVMSELRSTIPANIRRGT